MFLLEMERQRKTRTFRIDEVVIDGLNKLAKKRGISANRLLEIILFQELKGEGVINKSTELLGETRGGDQKSEAAKSKQQTENKESL